MSALRTGYTTGSCAAAAAKAAVLLLAEGRVAESLEIPLPGGARVVLPLVYSRLTEGGAEAAVRKDAGDDPDVTNGALILASVAWSEGEEVEFSAGEGVGMVTKPGLAIPPGEPAINPVPRRMIREAVREVTPRGVRVTIAIPGGGEIARKTFNPRIGIIGGLSILGTTGIVRPFSCSAIRETLRCTLTSPRRRASGRRSSSPATSASGRRGPISASRTEQIVEVGNEWGFALDEALRRPFSDLLILGHPGKLAKLTAGDWDTHSGRSASALPIVARIHAETLGQPRGGGHDGRGAFREPSTRRRKRSGDALAEAVKEAVGERTEGRFTPAVVLIDLGGRIIGSAGDLKPWP